MVEFIAWPKTPRLFRDITITEKIDGTNACIIFDDENDVIESNEPWRYTHQGVEVAAQSRKRIITPKDDNFGFAGWVHDNRDILFGILGPGRHYGEWWGKGVQRNYGRETRTFSLFNTRKWGDMTSTLVGDAYLQVAPILYQGEFSQNQVIAALRDLKENGSYAAPGFMNPEGIVVYHEQAGKVFKVTLDNEDRSKWEVE